MSQIFTMEFLWLKSVQSSQKMCQGGLEPNRFEQHTRFQSQPGTASKAHDKVVQGLRSTHATWEDKRLMLPNTNPPPEVAGRRLTCSPHITSWRLPTVSSCEQCESLCAKFGSVRRALKFNVAVVWFGINKGCAACQGVHRRNCAS